MNEPYHTEVLCEVLELNPVQFRMEPYYPHWRRRRKHVLAAIWIAIAVRQAVQVDRR